MLMMPVSGRMTITSKATTSIRGLLTINSPTQAISAPKTKSRSAFIARRSDHLQRAATVTGSAWTRLDNTTASKVP